MNTQSSIYDEILRLFGTLEDHKVLQIAGLAPSIDELEITSAYVAGLDDIMGKSHHPLTGKPAEIYDIVTSDDLAEEDDYRAA